jgi:hypothetical protein
MRYHLDIRTAVIASLALAVAATASAQSPRFEVAGQATLLRLSNPGATNAGLGGRFLINLSNWVAVDTEFNYFPADDIVSSSSFGGGLEISHLRRRAEGLFGAKVGRRGGRFGAFGKIRPGFTRLSDRGIRCGGDGCALVLLARPIYRTEFAVDFGSVFEFYPSPRIVTRFDLGDTLIRHRSAAPPCGSRQCTSHNVSSGFGVGVRF